MNKKTICELELDEDKVKQFKEAIENSYWFEFFMGMLCLSLMQLLVLYLLVTMNFHGLLSSFQYMLVKQKVDLAY